jgi:hypothetical protein
MRPLVWGATGLERWYELGQIDWVSELEYPEWTVKEIGRFLQYQWFFIQ